MTSETQFLNKLMLGYQGIAQKWECDNMGHLNVSHYFGRSSDQAFFTRHALGLDPQFARQRPRHGGAEEHCRFHREVTSGGMMIGRSAVIEPRERTMVVYQEFRDAKDALQASFRTVIGFFDTKARRLMPWPEATREKAAKLTIDLPDHAAPLRVPAGGAVGQVSREASIAKGFSEAAVPASIAGNATSSGI